MFRIFKSANVASTAPELEYSVIVPVFNKCGSIEGTIRTIKRQIQKPSTIIVVDDGSADGSQKSWKVMRIERRLSIYVLTITVGGLCDKLCSQPRQCTFCAHFVCRYVFVIRLRSQRHAWFLLKDVVGVSRKRSLATYSLYTEKQTSGIPLWTEFTSL